MQLPDFPPLSSSVLREVAQRHGLGQVKPRRLPETGIFNAIYLLGAHHVLRIPRDHPGHVAALYREAAVVPAARAAGVRTPAQVAFDTRCELLRVPYAIYERVRGRDLAQLDLEPSAAAGVWRELGADLARLHLGVHTGHLAGTVPECEPLAGPRELAEALASGGWLTTAEARWLDAWLDRLAPDVLPATARRCLHGDSQATNVMVRPRGPDYLAVIDWGSAGWGDPAFDFAGVPLRAVPFMLDGYRALSPLDDDQTAEARILWRHLQLALYVLRRGQLPERSWAERPLPMLLDIMRFFLDAPGGRWAALAPPPSR